ncbi:laminin subunit alpha-2 [Ditylenchus destructor]|uniref:Laminin subunit alpha-2 n=1 Tax=Ditylenchus destructor TaxID=166010 RepID=A0AAD4NFG6_9BILA|nr:laminin subunit alpha-2 [Ditylenchus destructor]
MADYNRLVFNMSQIDEEESLAIFTPSTLGANSPQCVSSQTPNTGTPVRSFATPGPENAVASGSALATDSPNPYNSPKKASETPRSIACPAKRSRRPLIMLDPNLEQTMFDDSVYTNSPTNKMSPANKQSLDSEVSLLTPLPDAENASVCQVISDSTPNTQALDTEECENLKFTPAKEFFKLQRSLQIMTPDAYDTPSMGTVPITEKNEETTIATNSQSFGKEEKNDRLNFTTANQSSDSNTSRQLLSLSTENARLINPNVTSMSSTGSVNQNFESKLQAIEDHYKEQQFVLLEQVAQAEHKFEEKCAEVTKLTEMLSAATAQTQELSNCLAAAEEEKLMKQTLKESTAMDETGRINLEMSTIMEENTRNLEEHYKEQQNLLLDQVLQAEAKYDSLKSEKSALESKLRESEEKLKQQHSTLLEQIAQMEKDYNEVKTKKQLVDDEKQSLSEQIAQMEKDYNEVKTEKQLVDDEKQSLFEQVLQAEVKYDSLKSEKDALESKLRESEEKLKQQHSTLLEQIAQMEKDYNEVKTEKQLVDDEKQSLSEQIAQMEKDYNEVKTEKQLVDDEKQSLSEQVLQAEVKYDSLKSEKDALESKLRESEEKLKQQHSTLLEQIAQMEKDYNEVKTKKQLVDDEKQSLSEQNMCKLRGSAA